MTTPHILRRLALILLVPLALVAAEAVEEPRDITFRAKTDHSEQKYIEWLPPRFDAATMNDVLLAFHGHGSDRWQFIRDARGECRGTRDVAARLGLILVSPDYRAKTSWMGPQAEADVVQIIAELRQRHKVGRVFLVGGSMGGTGVLTFAALHPELVAGVCSLNGTANLVEYDQFQDAIAASFGGTKSQVPDEYKKRSAELWPNKFTMPVAFTTGGRDELVPPHSVLRLAEKLKQSGRKPLLIHRETGGHATTYEDTVAALEFVLQAAAVAPAAAAPAAKFVDLSLLVAPGYPCTWPTGFPRFHITPYLRIGSESAYNSEILQIDGNTGTQLDVPPHSVPRPSTKLPNAGPLGLETTDKTPAWKLVGEAVVVDVSELLDTAPLGQSSLIQKSHLVAWEKKHRPFRAGDVVLLRSGYSDKYYLPLPAGRRFLATPLEQKSPGWPDPHPDAMAYLADRNVTAVGTDSPSIGPIGELAEPTHFAGLKHGLVFTEGATQLGQLPVTGAFYCMLTPRHADGPYAEGRALGIVGGPANQLIESARARRVLDLSVVNAMDWPLTWPGVGVDDHRQPYAKVDFFHAPNLDIFHHTHLLDSHTGTHLVPPSYALPAPGFDNTKQAPLHQQWLKEYEAKFGARGHSTVTTEQVPLSQTCGPVRVIDVRHLVGTVPAKDWPASPEITRDDIRRAEFKQPPLRAGDIVIFLTGHVDRHFQRLPKGSACMADPLNGKSEGWPAPGPDVIAHLAARGIRCVATDAPTLGGVDPKRALMTYWAMGSKGMAGVEFLTQVDKLPLRAYFLFAPVKIRDCHGGPGRAIALY